MKAIFFILLAATTLLSVCAAHESVGRADSKEPLGVEVETEFYIGKEGYLHGGLGAIAPLNETQKVGVVGHFVREETGGDYFPSLGAEFIHEFESGYQVEAFSFGYFPVDQQSAWAIGARGSRRFDVNDGLAITPFFGPSYADVRALDEATDSPVDIGHVLLLAGIGFETGPVGFTVFGSHSFFSRDPVGLETHVDLEEMTHLAAYENNDGFARNTVGGELSYAPWEWLTLTGRYALILYEDGTRNSVSFAPTVSLGEHVEMFVGVQFLRGADGDNDLLMTGLAYTF